MYIRVNKCEIHMFCFFVQGEIGIKQQYIKQKKKNVI